MKASLMIAIATMLMVASFAGVAMIDDEADAVEGEYNVTYSINGSTIVESTTGGAYSFKDIMSVLPTYDVPTGYQFVGWKDVASPTVYSINTEYTLAGNVTVEPYLKVTGVVISFVYGEVTYTMPGVDSESIGSGVSVGATTIKAFADKAGLIYTEAPEDDGTNVLKMISIKGYEFKGFSIEGSEELITTLDKMVVTEPGSVVYTAVFEPIYTISFVVDGTTISTQISNDLEIPAAPSKPNYSFDGWYDAEGVMYSDKYEFTTDTVFTAVFKPIQLTVTFVAEGNDVTPQTVLYGNKATVPQDPVLDGHKFVGWYDAEGNLFDFATAITADMTLTAKFEVVQVYNVTFVIEGKAPSTMKSDSLTVPNPDREGYVFAGWIIVGGDSKKLTTAEVYDYDYTGDVTFQAIYDVAPAPVEPETPWYETNTGIIAIFLVIMAICFLAYCYRTNTFGVKDMLSFKLVRDKKE